MKLFQIFVFVFIGVVVLTACKDSSPGKAANQQPETPENPAKKETVIYLVRHAEKATNHPTDPDLSPAGETRAIALKDSLEKLPVAAVYVTPYKRTRKTALPLANAKNLPLREYALNQVKTIPDTILKYFPNRTVLLVGHSNTVLETLEAFKVKRPVAEISDADYNYLFKVTIPKNGAPKAEATRYGN